MSGRNKNNNPIKVKLQKELKELKKKGEAPEWMNWLSYAMLKHGFLNGKTPKKRYREIANAAAKYLPNDNKKWSNKFFNLFWKNWLAPSTPVMANLGTNKGLAVSCSASYVGDEMQQIAYGFYEVSMLSKYGFGTAVHLDLRPGHSEISTGGKTNPIKDWVEMYWYLQHKVSQGSTRRGATAIYIDFWKPDLIEILKMQETHDRLHLGVIVDKTAKEALKRGDRKALQIYQSLLTWRMRKGKPYIIFIDNAQEQERDTYGKLGLKTKHSNLCSEIFSPTDKDHTFSCVLSSMCGHRYDEWKDTDAVQTALVFLDCVNEDLIQRGSNKRGLEKVVRFAKKSRSLGLGLLGFHTYLQSKMIPIDSFQARLVNAEIFKHLHDETLKASQFMADWLGKPEWCEHLDVRNIQRTAIAPNTTSSFISGAVSQGIEPFASNVFRQKLSKIGAVERINPELVKLLKSKGKFTDEVIDELSFNKGSVQNLEFLTDEEKNVFKTAFEINQKILIDLAEQRQQFIDHGQSLNLFFDANETEEWIHEVHKYAFEKKRLKSLYYVRTMAGISADKGDECKACEG